MASILKFVARNRTQPERSGATAGQCEIVIFPGVRYERWQDEETPKPTPRPKRRRTRRARSS